MSEEFRVNIPAEGNQKAVEFFFLKYKTSTLDLSSINNYTKYTVPESVDIIPPDLSMYDHTTVLIGFYGDPESPKIIIWLAGNYNYNNVSLYADYDQDRNFTNDKKVLQITRGSDPLELALTLENGNHNFWFGLPKITVKVNKPKRRIENRFAVTFQIGAGSGNLKYSSDGLQGNSADSYYVNISEKNLGTSLSYYMKNFIVGTSLSYQNHNHYASYYFIGGRRTGGINQDLHATDKFHIGLYGAYRFRITDFIELQPLLRYGVTQYPNREYKPMRSRDEIYLLGASRFLEYGIRLEFKAGIKNVFFIEIAKNRQNWKPQGLPASKLGSFKSRVKIAKFGVGFSVPLDF